MKLNVMKKNISMHKDIQQQQHQKQQHRSAAAVFKAPLKYHVIRCIIIHMHIQEVAGYTRSEEPTGEVTHDSNNQIWFLTNLRDFSGGVSVLLRLSHSLYTYINIYTYIYI